MAQTCPDDMLEEAAARMKAGDLEGLEFVDGLLTLYESDERLNFLRGSLLWSLRRHAEADRAITRALEIEPNFALARLSLGIAKLTSGDGLGGRATLLPLELLPTQDPLRLFANGLQHFINDEWEAAADMIRRGIECNSVNVPLNTNMELFLREALARVSHSPEAASQPQTSAVHSLLSRFDFKGSRH